MAAKKTPPAKSARSSAPPVQIIDSPVNRKGVHAKRGSSASKASKNYKKPYRGQGRNR